MKKLSTRVRNHACDSETTKVVVGLPKSFKKDPFKKTTRKCCVLKTYFDVRTEM